MNSTILNAKQTLRKQCMKLLKEIPEDERLRQGKWLTNALLQSDVFKKSKTIAVYVSLPSEVPTLSIIEQVLEEKKCFLPKITSDGEMKMLQIYSKADFNSLPLINYTKFALIEPTLEYNNQPRNIGSPSDIPLDLVIVPGLAFDKKGGRLGRGKGFYDSFIKKYIKESESLGMKRPQFVALAFAEQQVEEVPMGELDMRVDNVIFCPKHF